MTTIRREMVGHGFLSDRWGQYDTRKANVIQITFIMVFCLAFQYRLRNYICTWFYFLSLKSSDFWKHLSTHLLWKEEIYLDILKKCNIIASLDRIFINIVWNKIGELQYIFFTDINQVLCQCVLRSNANLMFVYVLLTRSGKKHIKSTRK